MSPGGRTPGSKDRDKFHFRRGNRNLIGQIYCSQQGKFIDKCPIDQGNCLDMDMFDCIEYWIKEREL